MRTRSVLIVLFDGVQSLDVSGPLEVLHGAGGYAIRTASLTGAPVRSASGLGLIPDTDLAAAADPPPDVLLVPGGRGTRQPQPELVDWLRTHGPRAGRLVSVCTGAFLLAEAGLLDGHRVTTHWAQAETLARRFTRVEVDPEPIFIRDGSLATSAGVTSGIDLALALVEEDMGREVALTVARQLVVFLRRPGGQAQFSVQLRAQTARREPLRRLQHWIVEHPDADLTVPALAARAGLSERQFARAFAAEVGMNPGRYVDAVRLEAARRRLEDSADGVAPIARACGYGTAEAMRRAFLRVLGLGPAEYRRRFRPTPEPVAQLEA
jgi:transcriptional regulator GlxA family with amidase domain